MQTSSEINSGLSDLELLALFDENCLDPCGVVGSSYQRSNDVSSLPNELWMPNAGLFETQNENDLSIDLDAYLITDDDFFPINATTSNSQDTCAHAQDDLEQLMSIDMSDFEELQKESGNGADLDAGISLEFSRLFLGNAPPAKNIKTDSYNFAPPLAPCFKCLFCEQYFSDKIIWRRHNVRHCKQILRCSRCKIRMRSSNAIRKHYSYHHVPIPTWKKTLIMFHDAV